MIPIKNCATSLLYVEPEKISFKQILFYVVIFSLISERTCLSPETEVSSVSSVISREIRKEGFHRELIYKSEVQTSGTWNNCKLVLEEIISSSYYVNTDELADLNRFGKVSAFANTTVDTESPQSSADPHSVFIYSNLIHTSSNKFSSSFFLPVHLRYHNPQPGGGYRKAFLNSPIVYIHCTEAPVCQEAKVRVLPCSDLRKTLCLFQEIPHILETTQDYIDVPVGNSDHSFIVIFITFLVTTLGSIAVTSVVIMNRNQNVINK